MDPLPQVVMGFSSLLIISHRNRVKKSAHMAHVCDSFSELPRRILLIFAPLERGERALYENIYDCRAEKKLSQREVCLFFLIPKKKGLVRAETWIFK